MIKYLIVAILWVTLLTYNFYRTTYTLALYHEKVHKLIYESFCYNATIRINQTLFIESAYTETTGRIENCDPKEVDMMELMHLMNEMFGYHILAIYQSIIFNFFVFSGLLFITFLILKED